MGAAAGRDGVLELSAECRRVLVDEFLPHSSGAGGLLIEWLSRGGAGGATLAFLLAREEQRRGAAVVVIDRHREFYPPAAAALGLDLAELIVVCPGSQNDALWAWEQSLRSRGATVVGPLEQVPVHALRRLKLAAEHGGGLALLLRPSRLQATASWADLRLAATPTASPDRVGLCRRVRVEALYVRGGFDRRSLVVDITDETASLSLVSELADRASADVATRAS